MPSGYTPCPCRDCFDIGMDGKLCHTCAEHDCDATGNSECESPGAYGCDEEAPDYSWSNAQQAIARVRGES